MALYEVLRSHVGDVNYLQGGTREADPLEVSHLVESGVLKLKSVKLVQNKAVTVDKDKAG